MIQRTYQNITDLQKAIQQGEVVDVTGFDCKGELFINDQNGFTVFSAYYGTSNACEDICALLGIEIQEV